MHGLLSKWGAYPVIADSQQQALDQLQRLGEDENRTPALLLVDYHLGDNITGIKVIEALRRSAGDELPAIILTADHTEEVAAIVRDAGHGLLHKPIKPAALRAMINRILSRRSLG